ncbi:hypothetical protein LG3211_4820 [Lysobacter gummosus]|nr:hypothetical protein LG3211_4820 [Lysobacter gummosus]
MAQSLKYVQPDHLGTPRAVIDPGRGASGIAIWTDTLMMTKEGANQC